MPIFLELQILQVLGRGHSQIRNDGIADMPIASRVALPLDALPTGADCSPAADVTASPPHPQPQPQQQSHHHPQLLTQLQ